MVTYTRGSTLTPAAVTAMTLVDGDDYPLNIAGYDNGSPFIVKDYDFGSPAPREVLIDKAGRPGVDDFTSLFGSRTITLQLYIMDAVEASRHQLLELLRSTCNPSHRPWLYAQCQGWEQERRISLRGQPLSCVVGQNHSTYLEVSLVYAAPYGVWEAVDPTDDSPLPPYQALINPISVTTAFSIPSGALSSAALTIPSGGTAGAGPDPTIPALLITSGSNSNMTPLTTLGTAPSYPVFVVSGRCTDPIIHNLTDNTTFSLAGYTVPANHFVTIDMNAQTVLLDGNAGISIYSKVDWSVSSWFSLTKATIIQFTTSSNDNNSSLAIYYNQNYF